MPVIYITSELYGPRGAGYELDRLEKGPAGRTLERMEASLARNTMAVELRTHVITGYLKSTIHMSSNFAISVWSGTISGARYPGIYELARGDSPTKYHPYPGHHNFFGPYGPSFEKDVRQAVWDFVTDGDGGEAPPGDLTFFAGGNGFHGTVP